MTWSTYLIGTYVANLERLPKSDWEHCQDKDTISFKGEDPSP